MNYIKYKLNFLYYLLIQKLQLETETRPSRRSSVCTPDSDDDVLGELPYTPDIIDSVLVQG